MNDSRLTTIFGALGDVQRLRALRFIANRRPDGRGTHEAVCACDVQAHLELSQPATSYHMKVLTEAGLVTAEKRGRWVHYRVSSDGIAAVRSFVDELEDGAAAVAGIAG